MNESGATGGHYRRSFNATKALVMLQEELRGCFFLHDQVGKTKFLFCNVVRCMPPPAPDQFFDKHVDKIRFATKLQGKSRTKFSNSAYIAEVSHDTGVGRCIVGQSGGRFFGEKI